MTTQTANAIAQYQRELEKALASAARSVRSAAIEDASEFLADEVHAMDAGRLVSEKAAYARFVERFGTPEQLAATYLDQCEPVAQATCGVGTKSGIGVQIAAGLVIALAAISGVSQAALDEPPKLSPFTEVVFENEQVIVTCEGERYQWLGLDDLSVDAIVASAKKQFGDRWQKRVAEDLVEVLEGMDYEPGTMVRLLLSNRKTEQAVSLTTAMTEDNRWAVYRKRRNAEAANIDRTLKTGAGDPPKLSPFTDVRFKDDQILVTFEGTNYQWLSLDKFAVEDIIASSKKQFGDRWQKRVAEDLVEVLWGMDHQPSRNVELHLVEADTDAERVVVAPMTESNRWAVYERRRKL